MAKKTTRRRRSGINISQEVDTLLTTNRGIAIGEVVAAIQKLDPKAKEGSIRTSYYTNDKRGGKRRKKRIVRKPGRRAAAGSAVTVDDLKAAKKLIEAVGSAEKAAAAVKALGELV